MSSVPGLSNMSAGLAFPISQYPSGMPQSNDCHQLGYDLISQSHHHAHTFANSFPNHPHAHHSSGMASFSDYGKQSEEYSKVMHSMATSEGHHFAKAATATTAGSATTNPGTASMIDCYTKLAVPEANNNWNHQSYAASGPPATNPGAPYGSSSSSVNPFPVTDYSSHQYGINIGPNF